MDKERTDNVGEVHLNIILVFLLSWNSDVRYNQFLLTTFLTFHFSFTFWILLSCRFNRKMVELGLSLNVLSF